MSWKSILKNSAMEELNGIINFIESNRSILTREKAGITRGTLTEEIAEKILNDLKNGERSPYNQIDTDNVSLYIDDGFHIRFFEMGGHPETGSGDIDYSYNFYTQDYITMMKNPEEVYDFVVKFIEMIGIPPAQIELDKTGMSLDTLKQGGLHWVPNKRAEKIIGSPKKATPTGYRPQFEDD